MYRMIMAGSGPRPHFSNALIAISIMSTLTLLCIWQLWSNRVYRMVQTFDYPHDYKPLVDSKQEWCTGNLGALVPPLVFLVMSNPMNWESRAAARSTWGSELYMKPVFFTGLPVNNNVSTLFDEAELYKDMVIDNFMDTTWNQTLKMMFMLRWLTKCQKGTLPIYVMIVNDDMYIAADDLIEKSRSWPNDNSLIGRQTSVLVKSFGHESKLYYLQGQSGIVIPSYMVRPLFEYAKTVPFIPYTDIYFTGLIASRKLGCRLVNEESFVESRPDFPEEPCVISGLTTANDIKPRQLLRMWEARKKDAKRSEPCCAIWFYIRNSFYNLNYGWMFRYAHLVCS